MSVTLETLHRKYGNLTADQQSRLDRAAVDSGVSVLQLMEIAGWQVACWLFRLCRGRPAPVLVVAGHGNNGGDGLVAARHLLTWGFAVEVALVAEPDRIGELVTTNLRAVRALGATVVPAPDGRLDAARLASGVIVVDALLGTGVRGDPRPQQAEAIARLPADRTYSIDVPSGLDATTGAPGRPTVSAAGTCTLAAMKAGLWTAAGGGHAGARIVADIGMPAAAWDAAGLTPPSLVRGGRLVPVPTDTPPRSGGWPRPGSAAGQPGEGGR